MRTKLWEEENRTLEGVILGLSAVSDRKQSQTGLNKGRDFISSCNWEVQKQTFRALAMAGSRC